MVGRGVETCRLIRPPLVANTSRAGLVAPVLDRLFVVAQDVNNGRVLHEYGLEGWRMTRYMVSQSLNIPRSQELTKVFFQIWRENPRGTKSTDSWGGLSFPPAYRCIECLKCQGPKGFLNVLSKATKSIAHRETPFVGSKKPCSLKSGQHVGS